MNDPHTSTNAERYARAEIQMWQALGALYRRRWLVIIVTTIVAIGAIVISLLLPKWYLASTRCLLPDAGSTSGAAALLNSLRANRSAAALLGGSGGDYVRYFAILDSRTMYQDVVETFDLIHVYDVADSPDPMTDAIELLDENTEFEIDVEYEYMSLSVLDRDPQRAADMANFYVERLNAFNARLSSENAGNFRKYVEDHFSRLVTQRDSILAKVKRFQEAYGVIEPNLQAEAALTALANLKVSILEAEITLYALQQQYGANNAQVQAAQAALNKAQEAEQDFLRGNDYILPISQSELPEAMLEYATLFQEGEILVEVLKFVAPLVEQARFDERKQMLSVQVVDPAIAPSEKAFPRRAIIVIAATMSGFLLVVLFVLISDWWHRQGPTLLSRLQAEAANTPPSFTD